MMTKGNARENRAARRALLLARVNAKRQEGCSLAAAARKAGVSVVSLWRWRRRLEAEGPEGLLPRTARCGRMSVAELLAITEADVARVRQLAARLGSIAAAWRAYARLKDCPPDLRHYLKLTRTIPPSMRQAVRQNSLKEAA